MKKKAFYLASIITAAALLTACGDSRPSAQTGETEQAATGSPTESTPADASDKVAADVMVGSWVLDMDETEQNLKQYGSMQELFGTGLSEGTSLNIKEDGSMDYYIGIGVGGEGTWQITAENTITAEVTPYEGHGENETEELVITRTDRNGKTYVTMPLFEETIYWKAADAAPAVYYAPQNPGWDYYMAGSGIETARQVPALKELSSESADVADDSRWSEENDLSIVEFPYSDENYKYEVSGDNAYDVYILTLTNVTTGELVAEYDFQDFRYAEDFDEADRDFISQRICFAKVQDDILYVSIAHNTYAASSPHTGYLMAFDMKTGDILWKTEPLTNNARSFAVVEGGIVCGYGFTAEDDFLYVVDIHDGTIVQTLPLKTQAEYIVQKDQNIYVKTYNMSYVFEIQY